MELERLKQEVKLVDYIGGNGVKKVGADIYRVDPCPVCGHNEHFTIYSDSNSYSSFSNCCQGGSIIDYFMEVEGMDQAQAINKVKQLAGVEVDRPREPEKQMSEAEKKETTSLVEVAKKNTCQYYYTRGLTDKTIKKYSLGYLPEGIKKRGQLFKCILPVSENFIIYRKNNDQDPDRYHNEGNTEVFNIRYLQDPSLTEKEIYLTEGIFDALSMEELDRPAVALNSTAMADKLIEAITENRDKLGQKLLILAFDNDQTGQDTKDKFKEALNGLNLAYMSFEFEKGYKDLNEYLINDREGLEQELKELPLKGTVYDYLTEAFWLEHSKNSRKTDIKTGFKLLDHNLDGGLYPGLYVLGSISSLGKTALALQMADNIAEQGQQVLFFSLEMGRYEMTCRSLTREMFVKAETRDINTGNILKGRYLDGRPFDSGLLEDILEHYRENTGRYITILEGNFDIDVNKIKQLINEHKHRTGEKPVVFIDYLQVLKPLDIRMTEKQHIDQTVVELKRMARDLDISIIAISSFNRASYKNPVDFVAFKESGSIEYTSDVVFGLQLRGANSDSEDINELKNREPRPLELVILKNRRGRPYDTIPLDYWPKVNYFSEA